VAVKASTRKAKAKRLCFFIMFGSSLVAGSEKNTKIKHRVPNNPNTDNNNSNQMHF
jgi:hypothetical protein